MKKIISLIMVLILLMQFVGCSKANNNNSTNSDKDVSDWIANEEHENNNASDSDEKEFALVNDINKIYEFVNTNMVSLTKEDFENNYKPFYFDINQDGNLDVCYSTEEWYGDLIYILSANGGYEVLEADSSSMDKVNKISFDDNFIVVEGENIGNGYGDQRTDIYYYTGDYVKYLDSFITYLFNGAQSYMEGKGNITLFDGYKDFEYTYDQFYYNEYGKETQDIHTDLTYYFDDIDITYLIDENSENFNNLE